MLDRLWEWVRESIEELVVDEVPIGMRITNLAESWDVPIEVARRIAYSYASLHGMGIAPAMDELCAMEYAEAVREIGER
jgi:hypothetical protein